ncbi:assimilatory nitrate reductase NasA [Haloglomus litoreum]|uniref:assimilatory nitrate reductase NasA n=1 Tax=Haloglomus litoreum TaxID=3034026 RepID=UPI0023E8D219|nr:assimilatory nitrate reductase NasA [Haloglomus sp. DT116]
MTEWVSTTCMRCAVGCGHRQRAVDDGYGIDTVSGDPMHPVSEGLACRRGTRESADPDGTWLTRPLVRRDGELRSTTWENALEEAAGAMRRAMARDPDAVAVLGSGQQTNEAAYALGKLARGGIGTRYYDANTTLCMASAVTAYYDAFGSDAPPCTYDDIPEAESHVVWGANPAVAHPVMFRWIRASAENGDLLVVDPVATETADLADTHVAPDPGGDLALARAVLARVLDRDDADEAFVAAATTGFAELRAKLPDAEVAAAEAGVPMADVDALADAFDGRTLVYWGMGVNQSVDGTATSGALIDICLATGNLGPGTGPFSLTGQANSMGTRVCSSKGSWPGHRDFQDPHERAAVADYWDVDPGRLPDDTGPGPVGTLRAVEDEVDVVWTVATNPVAGVPDAGNVAGRLDEAFLVVQDAFHSETVEHADVVLPAATWGESEGTVMNMERTVSRVRAATETPSGVKQDIDIIADIGQRLCPGLLGEPPLDPEAVFREFCDLTADTDADCSGLSYTRLEAETAVRWPAPGPRASGGYRYHSPADDGAGPTETVDGDADATDADGEAAAPTGADADWSFPTPSGKARFSTAVEPHDAEPTDESYPLVLTTGREADGYNTGVRSREGPGEPTAPVARVAPATMSEVADGDREVSLASRRGSVDVTLHPDEAVPDGVVWLSIHHPATNRLTTPERDPRSAEPNLKQCAVRVEPRTEESEAKGAEPDEETPTDRPAPVGEVAE